MWLWTKSMDPAHTVHRFHETGAVACWMDGSDQIQWRGISRSNLGRRLTRGQRQAFLLSRSGSTETEHRKAPWLPAWGSSSWLPRARKATGFDSTWSRPRGDPTLLTCDSENESRRAGGDRAGWTNFNGGRGSFQRCSSPKVHSGGGGVGGDPPPSDESARESPVRWLDGSVVARQWWLGCGPNSHGIGHYL
jgi:hypothetical protein